MEIGIAIGGVLIVGSLYEFIRSGIRNRNSNFTNNNFFVFYDNFGNRNILRLDPNLINRRNSINNINENTKVYISTGDLGICTISQEEIKSGDEVRELNCGHFFKKEYIDIWLSENNVCPMCRKNFKLNVN